MTNIKISATFKSEVTAASDGRRFVIVGKELPMLVVGRGDAAGALTESVTSFLTSIEDVAGREGLEEYLSARGVDFEIDDLSVLAERRTFDIPVGRR